MYSWNFGDLFDALGPRLGARPALIHCGATANPRVISWEQLHRRTNNIAWGLLGRGAQYGDKVAFYLRNSPAYMELAIACCKARLVHANVNYRYVDEELWYILDNSDATVIVYDAEFRSPVERLRERLPRVQQFIEVADGAAPTPPATFAKSYEAMAENGTGTPLDIMRSGDDLLFIYTGGTTGMPKAAMWRQADRIGVFHMNQAELPEGHADIVVAQEAFTTHLPACPLMHSTGFTSSLSVLVGGGCVVTMAGKRFDARTCLQTIAAQRVTAIAIVGDAFANPVLAELDENPGVYDLSSLERITSAGVMWSAAAKAGLLRHKPTLVLIDSLGSSEGSGLASSTMRAGQAQETAHFTVGENVKVFTEDLIEVQPGSGVPGMIAKAGHIPLGYFKDPERTARTFPVVNGVRYVLPGDWCTVAADGSIMLLGRGSHCINTGGEKVYPEEVEEALKRHALVHDALVIGLPDPRWGHAVTAVVQLRGAVANGPGEGHLRAFLHAHLADYKIPKRIVFSTDLGRAANGKADYNAVREFALAILQRDGEPLSPRVTTHDVAASQ